MPFTVHMRYQIDDLTLDTRLGTLRRGSDEIALPHLSYRLLCELVVQSPAIVTQDELMNRVWAEQVVSDETLKQRIKLLRQALADSPQAPKYIESVRGRGYRCIAPVTKQTIKEPITHDSINLKLNDRLPIALLQNSAEYWRLAGLFIGVTLMVFVVMLAINYFLPLKKITETRLPAPTSAISSQAKAAYDRGRMFYLRYQSMDNEMAIKSYQRATELDANFALAYAGLADAYSQGVFQFSAGDSWRKKALDAAYDAIMLDDRLAQSYKSLGNAHFVNGHISQSLTADLKAVELAPDFVEAQASLGYIYSERGELKNALERHLIVYQLNPNYQVNWFHIALTLHRLGQNKQAQWWYQRMLQGQPNYHLATYHYSRLLLQVKQPEQALALLQAAEKRSPDSINVLKGLIEYHLLNSQFDAAAPWIHKLSLLSSGENRQYGELLSQLLASPIESKTLVAWYQKHRQEYSESAFHNIELAMAATGLNDIDSALRHLTEAIELGWLESDFLQHLKFFEPLRQDSRYPRIAQLLQRKQLSQRQSAQPQISKITNL